MSTHDPTLFDLTAGERAKERGQLEAEGADRIAVWKLEARDALAWLAARGEPFTADDLARLVGLPDTGPNRSNAVGAVFSAAARQGLIRSTGHYRKSRRTLSHARVVAVWCGARKATP